MAHSVSPRRRVRARIAGLLLAMSMALLAPVAAQFNGQPASTVLGQPNFASNNQTFGPYGLFSAVGLAVDPATGKLFVADGQFDRVLRYSSAAALATYAPAEAVLGQPNFESGAPGTSATSMNDPLGLTIDSTGRLWVADTASNRVLGFDSPTTKANGAAADIVLGQPDFTSSAGATTQTGMNQPFAVTADTSGRLWVADTGNNRVLRFDTTQSLGNGAPANGVLGQPDFVSANRNLSPSATSFDQATSLAADTAGNLWVGDAVWNRIVRFDAAAATPNGGAADAVLGQPNLNQIVFSAVSSTTISTPLDMEVDAAGSLWVADQGYNRVLRFPNAAVAANNAAADLVLGQRNFSFSDPGIGRALMDGPSGIAIAGSNVWISDGGNVRVLRFSTAATEIPPAGRAWLPLINR